MLKAKVHPLVQPEVELNSMDSLPMSIDSEHIDRNKKKLKLCNPNEHEYRIVNINKPQIFSFRSNFVKTSKYSLITFFPIFLFEEFHYKKKIANLYFLFISSMQCIPLITNTNGLPTTLIPLTFVVLVSAIFSILEDIQRHHADNEANSRKILVYNSERRCFEDTQWNSLQVGDIVKVLNREQIPADLCILGVNEQDPENPTGVCYVETKSLDGETNLKLRQCVQSTIGKVKGEGDVRMLKGYVEMEHPNKLIDSFTGVLALEDMRSPVAYASVQTIDSAAADHKEPHIPNPLGVAEELLGRKDAFNQNGSLNVSISEEVLPTLPRHRASNAEEHKRPLDDMLDCDEEEKTMPSVWDGHIKAEQRKSTFAEVPASEVMRPTRENRFQSDGSLGSISAQVAPITPVTRIPLQTKNLLLRGCVLRNTQWIIGAVLNTGHDTKIIQSIKEAPRKNSSLEMRINAEIKHVAGFLFLVCVTGAAGSAFWNYTWARRNIYLYWGDLVPQASFTYFIVQVFYYLLLLSNFIPVSLYVTMAMVKFFQAKFMNQDIDMYHEPTDTPALVRTFTLNEELGQITHLFSDKTGTLTENVMDFRKCSINGYMYGRGLTEIGKAALKEMGVPVPQEEEEAEAKARQNRADHVAFYDDNFYCDLRQEPNCVAGQHAKIEEFFRILAICHTVIPEKVPDSDKIMLSASSPDDEALVCGAKYFGWDFQDRQDGSATLFCAATGTRESYEVLEVLDFTSKRKRMSVIVRTPDGQLKLFCKGADTVILPRLRPGQEMMWDITSQHMCKFALEGLRTLLICEANLPEAFYNQWQQDFDKATTDLQEIELQKKGEFNSIDRLTEVMEQNLELLGCSAIEDKLQDGVSQTIADLAQAGVKIWMLTGDKEETAINIAVACRLILPVEQMNRIIINEHVFDGIQEAITSSVKKEAALKEKLESELYRMIDNPTSRRKSRTHQSSHMCCLVIDGPTLIFAMKPSVKPSLLALAQKCKAVVGCRVSPDQKREMVALIKENVKDVRTLAIGDGANDVAMIQEAHVGVGISGQEGVQAVNSSDYAIAQFRFLRKLMLVHGHWNYRRMSKLVCYMFYKNVLMSLPMFWFAWANGFGGQKFYIEPGIQFYNLIYTSLPIILVGIYDQDISADFALRYPHLYFVGINDTFFTAKTFWVWMASSIWEACLIAIIPLFGVGYEFTSLYECGFVTFTCVILIVNLKLFLNQSRCTWVHLLIWLFSLSSWFLIAWGDNMLQSIDYGFYGAYKIALVQPRLYFCVAFLLMAAVTRDIYWKGYNRWLDPKPYHIVEEIEAFHIPEPKELGQHLHTENIQPSKKDSKEEISIQIKMPRGAHVQDENHNQRPNAIVARQNVQKKKTTNINIKEAMKNLTMHIGGFAYSVDESSELGQTHLIRLGIKRRRKEKSVKAQHEVVASGFKATMMKPAHIAFAKKNVSSFRGDKESL